MAIGRAALGQCRGFKACNLASGRFLEKEVRWREILPIGCWKTLVPGKRHVFQDDNVSMHKFHCVQTLLHERHDEVEHLK
ncbi:hypothetical protein TNCV_2744621 [Trichonephila clavipes]|nr:hypothetical protein TNCV_2744621 [Trichonephila clavipes]